MTTYRHLVGGEAYGVAHVPGDPVTSRAPKRKIEEWLKAGIVEKVADTENDESSENGEPEDELS